MYFSLPSLNILWRNRDMPEFGYLHDDGLQYLTAKSLAQGNGYRIQSLPENPAETKYPPLFPLVLINRLGRASRLSGQLGDRLLSIAAEPPWCCFSRFPWILFRRLRMPDWRLYLLSGLLAINPYLILLWNYSVFRGLLHLFCADRAYTCRARSHLLDDPCGIGRLSRLSHQDCRNRPAGCDPGLACLVASQAEACRGFRCGDATRNYWLEPLEPVRHEYVQ